MILAFHASDRGSIPSLATIFYFLFLFFAFVVFILILFFFFIFNCIDNPPTSAFRYKITKAVNILYCLQKFSLFLSSHSSCLHNRSIFDPTNEVFMQQIFLQGIYIRFLIICFSTAPNCYIYRTQKQTSEMSIAIQACTICMFGNRTV